MVMTDAAGPLSGLTPYELKNVVSHLLESGRVEDVLRLVQLADEDSRNAFFAARLHSGDASGYVDDLRKAQTWRRLEIRDGLVAHDEGSGLASEIAFSLSLSLARSELSCIKPSLLGLAVERGVWSVDHALIVARSARGQERALKAYASLAPVAARKGRPEVLDEALAVIAQRRRFRSPWISVGRYEELHDLGVDPSDESFERPVEFEKMRAIKRCSASLSSDRFLAALDAAYSIRAPGFRTEALGALMGCAGKGRDDLYGRILEQPSQGEEYSLLLALLDAIPHLDGGRRIDAEERAWRAVDEAWTSLSIRAWTNGLRDGRLTIRFPVTWFQERFESLHRLCLLSRNAPGPIETATDEAVIGRRAFIEATWIPALADRGLDAEALAALERVRHAHLSILAIEGLLLTNPGRSDRSGLLARCHERLRQLDEFGDPHVSGSASATVATLEVGSERARLCDVALSALGKMKAGEVKASVILKLLPIALDRSFDRSPQRKLRLVAAIEELEEPEDDEFYASVGKWLPDEVLERGLAVDARRKCSDIAPRFAEDMRTAAERSRARTEKPTERRAARDPPLPPEVARSVLALFESHMDPPTEGTPDLSDYVRHFFDFPAEEGGERIEAPEAHMVLTFVLERLPTECMQTGFDLAMNVPAQLRAELFLNAPVLEALHREDTLFDLLFRSLRLSENPALQSRIVDRLCEEAMGRRRSQVHAALVECLQRFEDLVPEKFFRSLLLVAPVLVAILGPKGNADNLAETCGRVWTSWAANDLGSERIVGQSSAPSELTDEDRVGAWCQLVWSLLLRREWQAAEHLYFHYLPSIHGHIERPIEACAALEMAVALLEHLGGERAVARGERLHRAALEYRGQLDPTDRDRFTAVAHFAWAWVLKRENCPTEFATFEKRAMREILDRSVKRSFRSALKALKEQLP